METYRSGSIPMSSKGQTNMQCDNPFKNLVAADGRESRRPDGDIRRNAITSIHWVPTLNSPKLCIGVNLSDHIHYYQGGLPFEYFLVDPSTGDLTRIILGPDLANGHKLQVPVQGGVWKCGWIYLGDGDEQKARQEYNADFCLIGEAVGPGFDFHDFIWITPTMIQEISPQHSDILLQFVHEDEAVLGADDKTVRVAEQFYEQGDLQTLRKAERI